MEGNAKDLILALEGLEREKNIKREDILKTIEDALVSALRKNLGKWGGWTKVFLQKPTNCNKILAFWHNLPKKYWHIKKKVVLYYS